MKRNTIGDKAQFAVTYSFFNTTRETELSMYIRGTNILAFERDGKQYTTRWNLDEIVLWLRNFVNSMKDDPYPVQSDGQYAAEKDINARDFDSDDEEEFDAYYDKLDEWNERHRWHPASSGAIIADVYFQLVGNYVEISWNNTDAENGVHFLNILGGEKVDKNLFFNVINNFLKEYAMHWFQ